MTPIRKATLQNAEQAAAMSHVPLSLTQRARPVDGAIEIAPAALDFDIGFVDLPAYPHLAALPAPQILGQSQRELYLPVAHCFATEYDAADEVTQAQLVPAQNFFQIATASAEGEQLPAERVLIEMLLHQSCQSLKAFAHVGHTSRQPHPHAGGRRDQAADTGRLPEAAVVS